MITTQNRHAGGEQMGNDYENDAGQTQPAPSRPHFSACSQATGPHGLDSVAFPNHNRKPTHPKLVPRPPSFANALQNVQLCCIYLNSLPLSSLSAGLILPQFPAFETGSACERHPHCSLPPAPAAVSITVRKQSFCGTPR